TAQQHSQLKGALYPPHTMVRRSCTKERQTGGQASNHASEQCVARSRSRCHFHWRGRAEVVFLDRNPVSANLSCGDNHLKLRVGCPQQFLALTYKEFGRLCRESAVDQFLPFIFVERYQIEQVEHSQIPRGADFHGRKRCDTDRAGAGSQLQEMPP